MSFTIIAYKMIVLWSGVFYAAEYTGW